MQFALVHCNVINGELKYVFIVEKDGEMDMA